jgi:NADH-quinone oxidoreductase subunit N
MISSLENSSIALPEMVILATSCITLLLGLFFQKRFKLITYYSSLVGLIGAGVISFMYIGHYSTVAFEGLFISDDLAQLMKIFIYSTVILSFYYSQHYLEERAMPVSDYHVLGLFSTLGMMTLVSAHSFVTVYLGLELLSLPMYAMTAMRRTNGDSSEGAMKYFVMGAIASGMLLYGISLVYAVTGKLDLHEIAQMLTLSWNERGGLISFAMVFILAGVGFKLAAMPFHMWVPDVYQGAPSSVTLFIGTAPKIAALGMAIRILTIALPDIAVQWQQLILVMALLSAGAGNLLAIAQTKIKRMLAYSAISHMGYALFGVLATTTSGYSAALYYVLVYSITSAAAFGLIVLMSRGGVEIDSIDDLKGLNRRNPWLSLMMMLVLLSMAGIPPLVGFFAKLLVLKALVDAQLTWVAVLGLVFAVIGAYYYLRVIKVMYFDDSEYNSPLGFSRTTTLVFSLNCLALLYFGIFPEVLIQACTTAFAR